MPAFPAAPTQPWVNTYTHTGQPPHPASRLHWCPRPGRNRTRAQLAGRLASPEGCPQAMKHQVCTWTRKSMQGPNADT
eukprot:9290808-Alexandrium_andersonii.AAC.1